MSKKRRRQVEKEEVRMTKEKGLSACHWMRATDLLGKRKEKKKQRAVKKGGVVSQ